MAVKRRERESKVLCYAACVWTERKYAMLLNDVGSRHAGSDRMQYSSLSNDVHSRELVSRSLAHSAAPSPVPSVFEPVQRPPTVVNYNFGEFPAALARVMWSCSFQLMPHRSLAGTKLYCLVTEAHVCVDNLPNGW